MPLAHERSHARSSNTRRNGVHPNEAYFQQHTWSRADLSARRPEVKPRVAVEWFSSSKTGTAPSQTGFPWKIQVDGNSLIQTLQADEEDSI